MNVHLRVGENRIFSLKQAVLLYQEGSRAFATLHEVQCRPSEAPYLCAGQSVTTGFLETLAKGLGASMAAEVLPEHVLARTPEVIAWWRRAAGCCGNRSAHRGADTPESSSTEPGVAGRLLTTPAGRSLPTGR